MWELINEIIPKNKIFGDAAISEKHSNFFINKNNATFSQMNSLINFVKKKVKDQTGVKLELEIVVVE